MPAAALAAVAGQGLALHDCCCCCLWWFLLVCISADSKDVQGMCELSEVSCTFCSLIAAPSWFTCAGALGM